MAALDDASKALQKAKDAAESRLQQIENERKEIRATIKSLTSALKVLGKSSPSKDAPVDILVQDER